LTNQGPSVPGCLLHCCGMTETRRCDVSEARRFDTQVSNGFVRENGVSPYGFDSLLEYQASYKIAIVKFLGAVQAPRL
jgi:hypothetical protein